MGTGFHRVRADSLRELDAMTPTLWVLAVTFFGVGDVVSTTLGLSTGTLIEVGPLAAPALERFGLGALIAMKVCALSACFIVWREVSGSVAVLVPLWLVGFGMVLTGWNLSLLLVVS